MDMDVVARIEELLAQRGWTKYHLAKEANLSQSTISSMVIRGNNPTITTVESCCQAFGITLAEFFAPDSQEKEFTLEERRLICDWRNLSPEMQRAIQKLIAAAIAEKMASV